MLEAGHIRRLTETMVSAHVPLKAARTMLLQLQQTNVPLRPSVAGSGAATDASHSAGGLFSWNSKRAVICTLSIGGFSQWASLRSSLDAVELLQGLFQRFDQLREQAAPLSVVQQQQQQHHVTGNNNAGGGGGVGRSAPPPPPIPPPAKYHSFGDTFTAMYLDCRDDKDLVAAVQSIAGFAVRALRGGQDLLGQEVAAKRFMTAEIFGRDDRERNQLQQRQASQAPVTPRAAEPASLVFPCHSLRTICHVDVGSCGGAFCHLSKTICPIGPLAALTSTALHWLQGNLMAHSAAVGDVLFARGGRGGSDHNNGAGGGARRGPTTTANSRVASMGALVCSSKFLSILLRSNDVAMPSLAASMSRSAEGGPNLQQRQPFLLLDADHRADPRTINVTTLRNAISELETQQNWMNIVRQQQAIAHQRSSNAANFLYGGGAAGGGGSGSHRSGYLGSTSDGGVGSNPLIPPILQLPPDPTASNEESPPLIPFRLPEGPITATPIQYHATLSNRILLAIHPFDTAALTPTVAVRDVNNASSRPSMVTTMTTVATHVVSTTSAPGEPSVSTNSQAHTPHDAINFGNSFPQFSSTEARSPIARSPRDDGSGGGGGGAGGVIGAVVEISGSSAVGEHHRGVSASIWNPLQPSRLSLHPPPPQQQQQRSPTTAVNTIASDANTILRISTDEGEGSSRRDDGIFLSSSGQQHSSSPNAAGKQQTANTTHRTEQQQRVGNHLPAPFSTVHDGENDQQHEEEEAEEDEGDDVHNEPEDPLVSATKRVSLSLVGRFPPWNFLYRFDDPLTEEAYLHNYQSVLNPRELVISKLFCVASFIALIGVCGLDGDLSFTPITDYPLPWIVFGLIVCVISSVVAFFTDLRGAPINRFVHVALSISFQTLYIVAIAVASGRPHTDSDGVSQLGDSQLLWLYVMLNWAVNRPTATHPIIMVIRDTIVCSFFVFRTVYWFNVPGAPRMLYYYLYAAYIFVVLTMRVLGDAMRRYHFATGRLVEYMREELQNDYARLYKSLDLMVPSGVAGRLTQKAKRANTRKLRLGWAGDAAMTGAAAEDVDEDGSMRPLRIYGLLSNSFATSVQDTAFLVIEMHPPEQQTPTASTVGVSQHHHRSQGSRDACAAAAVDHFKTLDAIQSTLCAPGKRYHRRIECVKATATRSFWCALSRSSVEKDDDGEDTCGAEVNNNNGAAAEAADGNEAPRSSQEDGTPTPRPHNATAQHQPQHRTLNNSGGSVSRNRALLRFALKCVGLISPHTKVRMFLHCGPVVGAVAGGRAVSFEFYGGPSQLALDCTDHVEWNTVAISDRFESSCHFHLKPLKRQDTTAEAVAQLNEDEILVRAGLIAPQDGPLPHLHPLDEQDKIVSKVEHTNSDLQTEQVRDTIAPKQKSPYHFPISSLPPQPSSSSSLSPSSPMVPSVKLTMRIRGYSFPIHFRSLNMSGLRYTTTGGVVLAVATPAVAAAPSSASGTSTSAHKHQQHVADSLR
ncbi:transmembrane protein, putative [Bodo saltans]|uniref:Transmembrane protein, putative n=1 Tax=Bodo saltans TaxID=75058 RepID=A0A0S4JKF1_BODSA|nr:transmembrane protein, putative [Bodo saltans]|eukprot:CUG90685.1 transmembrane protein, putative [Bodo saltans]